MAKNNDFNGLGSSNIHLNNKILFSLGTPEKHASKNSSLAQDNLSKFGKILEVDKQELKDAIVNKSKLDIGVFSQGHRVPQGLTILNEKIFNVEHGPKGGDELNLVIKGKNYGWPIITYGINYSGTIITDKTSMDGMEQPLYYWVPSIAPSGMAAITTGLMSILKANDHILIPDSVYGSTRRFVIE